MTRQQITIPKNLECSICRANDPHKHWKQYVTKKEVVGEKVNWGRVAVVVKVGEWLLLTRWDNLTKASQNVKPVVNEAANTAPKGPQKRLFSMD
jgi:hypothetical protein